MHLGFCLPFTHAFPFLCFDLSLHGFNLITFLFHFLGFSPFFFFFGRGGGAGERREVTTIFSSPQWAYLEFSFFRPSPLPLCHVLFSKFFISPFSSNFLVPFTKTLTAAFCHEPLPVLFLPVIAVQKKTVRLHHPKSMIPSKLVNHYPNWSRWPTYLCAI